MKKNLLFSKLFVVALITVFSCMSFNATGQTVKHPVSGITNTATFHEHIFIPAPGYYKIIRYFLVLGPVSGEPRTAFDACDVCWSYFKGYSQLGINMRCNNCGNTYEIEGLGTSNTGGGCWPGYLPMTNDGVDVSINVSDLDGGAHYFQLQTGTTGINENDELSFSYMQHDGVLKVYMETNAKREIKLVNMIGQVQYSTTSSASEVSINTNDLNPRIYFLYIEEAGKVYTEKLFIH